MEIESFEAIYERYNADVYRFAVHLSGNPTLAEDITSETFVRVWTAPGKIRTTTVKAYLLTIARHLYLDEARAMHRHVDLDAEAIAAPGPSPHALTEQHTEAERMRRALAKLTESDRAALLMRANDELGYEEIAAALAISVSAAKVRVHRARVRLARMLTQREAR